MNTTIRRGLAVASVLALLVSFFPAAVLASEGTARLEGMLVNIDGRPATGYNVLLISQEGEVLARSEAADDGLYRFRDLQPGSYSLGIENPEGLAAPVINEPTPIRDGQLVRMDIKMMQSDVNLAPAAKGQPSGLRKWYAGLSKTAKIWTWVGVGAMATGTVLALDDDEDPASPTTP